MGRSAITRLAGAPFFCPDDVAALNEAVERSWRIVSAKGVSDDGVREVVAKGVVQAARRGERELDALTDAGCRTWEQSYV